jgi:diaminohydroxyphosphoribosylaminopyrimidine deaminase/5-amino-6-(5-phosphoribosylamino)uracil reductase
VVIGAIDPNPKHGGKAISLLKSAGITVASGVMQHQCSRLNEAFNHWMVHHRPFVTVKAAMTLDGKIATAEGDSKWITGERSRQHGMRLRLGADAVLVGIKTVLQDDPQLTFRAIRGKTSNEKRLRRVVLDSFARTPLTARVVCDQHAHETLIVVGESAPRKRVQALARRVQVLVAPGGSTAERSKAQSRELTNIHINLPWLLNTLGKEAVTSVLVEGGGEVNASFLMQGLAQRVAFFYAPKVLGGRHARRAVAGDGVSSVKEGLDLSEVQWRRFGADLFMTARVVTG